jgi:hypothetical protein
MTHERARRQEETKVMTGKEGTGAITGISKSKVKDEPYKRSRGIATEGIEIACAK